jgi:putative DNA methylase
LNRDALQQAFGRLASTVGERIRALYRTTDGESEVSDVLYYFWVKTMLCPVCSNRVDLFPSYIFARNAYPERKLEVRVCCPGCGGIFAAEVNDIHVDCPHCGLGFNPQAGPASGISATCRACHHTFAIAKAIKAGGHPPDHRLFAKLVLTGSGRKVYWRTRPEDETAYRFCMEELARSNFPLPTLELEDGYNTRQVLNYAYRSWREFFNDRQLLALGWLHQAILELPDDSVRAAMLTVFSGALEFNNMFASYKGEGTGAIRHMFAHHILKPERVPVEGNVWGTSKSSGSFSTLFKSRLFRAIEYRNAPFEVAIPGAHGGNGGKRAFGGSPPFSGAVSTLWPPARRTAPRTIHLSCGSSASTGLPASSVDLVVTDPPFFDNVHYSELADFFFAWQKLEPTPFSVNRPTTRHPEEVQDASPAQFEMKLRAVFTECDRVLRRDGLMVFSYHHSRSDGWTSLAEAVAGAGFSLVNCHPVKAEMSVAAPKSQAREPIQLDIILVCRKQAMDLRAKRESDNAMKLAVTQAEAKLLRLLKCGISLSVNDRRVVLFGQFLVEASAGRSATQLADALSLVMTDLDLAALRLPDKSEHRKTLYQRKQSEDAQLVLMERHSKGCRTRL